MTTTDASKPGAGARRRSRAKGRRPYFFDEPEIDKLLAIITALAGEVAVLRQRLDTHERVAAQRGLFGPADVETYTTTVAEDDERARWRAEYLGRVFRVLEFEASADERREAEQAYSTMIGGFASDDAAGKDSSR